MIIGFTGHRNATCDEQYLIAIARKYPDAVWVHGGAIGFDSQVADLAKRLHMTELVLRPKYDRYERSEAPLRRNDLIVHCAEALVACYDGRTHGGTFYTISRAKAKGIEIFTLDPIQ